MKKLIALALALSLVALCLTPVFAARVPGDADGDGKVTASDARIALRIAVELENIAPGSEAYKAANVDGDGKVTASDARLILRAAVGLEELGGGTDTPPAGGMTAEEAEGRFNEAMQLAYDWFTPVTAAYHVNLEQKYLNAETGKTYYRVEGGAYTTLGDLALAMKKVFAPAVSNPYLKDHYASYNGELYVDNELPMPRMGNASLTVTGITETKVTYTLTCSFGENEIVNYNYVMTKTNGEWIFAAPFTIVLIVG